MQAIRQEFRLCCRVYAGIAAGPKSISRLPARRGEAKQDEARRGIVAHVSTSCRLEMSRAILRTSTTRDKSAGIVAEHERSAYRDLDSLFEISSMASSTTLRHENYRVYFVLSRVASF